MEESRAQLWDVCRPFYSLFEMLHRSRAYDGGGFGPPRPRGLCPTAILATATALGMIHTPADSEDTIVLVQVLDTTWRAWDAEQTEHAMKTTKTKPGDPRPVDPTRPLAEQWAAQGVSSEQVTQMMTER